MLCTRQPQLPQYNVSHMAKKSTQCCTWPSGVRPQKTQRSRFAHTRIYTCADVCLHRNLNHVRSNAFPSGYNPARTNAMLSAFVYDGKISFIVEVWFLLWMLCVQCVCWTWPEPFYCVFNYLCKFVLWLQCTIVKCYALGCMYLIATFCCWIRIHDWIIRYCPFPVSCASYLDKYVFIFVYFYGHQM